MAAAARPPAEELSSLNERLDELIARRNELTARHSDKASSAQRLAAQAAFDEQGFETELAGKLYDAAQLRVQLAAMEQLVQQRRADAMNIERGVAEARAGESDARWSLASQFIPRGPFAKDIDELAAVFDKADDSPSVTKASSYGLSDSKLRLAVLSPRESLRSGLSGSSDMLSLLSTSRSRPAALTDVVRRHVSFGGSSSMSILAHRTSVSSDRASLRDVVGFSVTHGDAVEAAQAVLGAVAVEVVPSMRKPRAPASRPSGRRASADLRDLVTSRDVRPTRSARSPSAGSPQDIQLPVSPRRGGTPATAVAPLSASGASAAAGDASGAPTPVAGKKPRGSTSRMASTSVASPTVESITVTPALTSATEALLRAHFTRVDTLTAANDPPRDLPSFADIADTFKYPPAHPD
jgi:hypothetical protein